jgi:hypothetical protein
LILS